MTETPREYKKRIDEKWQKNAKNTEKLIQKIESYELLDEGFKSKTKQEILENFQKNQKADQESEQYIRIASELGKIDQKYDELKQIKQELKTKKDEKSQVEKEIRGSKLDGTDETTLKIQMSEVRKLKEKLKSLNGEIEELENDIQNRTQEIKEIEETYGKKNQDSEEEVLRSDNGFEGGDSSPLHSSEGQDKTQGKDELKGNKQTLKEYHDQTIQELWNKNRTRGEIFRLLDAGTGIDDELKERVKKEISEKFFGYYREKQGSLKMKTARHLKNKLNRGKQTYEGIKAMPDGEEKIEKLKKYERIEKAYRQRTRREIDKNMFDLEDVGIIGGKLCVKAKRTKNSLWNVIRGDKEYSCDFCEIGEIKEIGGKPCFKARFWNNKEWNVVRWNPDGKDVWDDICGGRDCFRKFCEIGEIKEIGGKPCFKAKDSDGYWRVMRGDEVMPWVGKEHFVKIGDIKDIEGVPCFKAEDKHEVYYIKGYEIIKQRESIGSATLDILEDIRYFLS